MQNVIFWDFNDHMFKISHHGHTHTLKLEVQKTSILAGKQCFSVAGLEIYYEILKRATQSTCLRSRYMIFEPNWTTGIIRGRSAS